jgi:hypothetical protein
VNHTQHSYRLKVCSVCGLRVSFHYLQAAAPPFVQLVPALHAAGFFLAIATHSDEAEYDTAGSTGGTSSAAAAAAAVGIHKETHILGHELATALLDRYFSAAIVAAFCIVAYNPRVRLGNGSADKEVENHKVKRYHMRRLQEHFGVEDPSRILLLDDTPAVVQDCRDFCGVQAVLVQSAEKGLQWSDILQLAALEYGSSGSV